MTEPECRVSHPLVQENGFLNDPSRRKSRQELRVKKYGKEIAERK